MCKATSLSPSQPPSKSSHTEGRASPMSQSLGVTQLATAGLPCLPHPSLGTPVKVLTLVYPTPCLLTSLWPLLLETGSNPLLSVAIISRPAGFPISE